MFLMINLFMLLFTLMFTQYINIMAHYVLYVFHTCFIRFSHLNYWYGYYDNKDLKYKYALNVSCPLSVNAATVITGLSELITHKPLMRKLLLRAADNCNGYISALEPRIVNMCDQYLILNWNHKMKHYWLRINFVIQKTQNSNY